MAERERDVEKQIFAFVVFADRGDTSTQIFLIQPLIYEMERERACVCASSYSSKFAAFVAVSVLLFSQTGGPKRFSLLTGHCVNLVRVGRNCATIRLTACEE